jgi:hypothetical protein
MENRLPILNILETPFFVDWDQRRITQVSDPQNSIPFSKADRPDGRATLLLDKMSKKEYRGTLQESLLDPNVVEIRLRNPSEIDLQAAKFGFEPRNGYDIDRARSLLQRIMAPFQQTTNRSKSL